jgi:dolichol-phosphate mannosyltransferase
MQLSIIIPCYNEEAVIAETHRRLTGVLQKTGLIYELIFINDGSKDNTLRILADLSKTDKATKILSFSRNFGHESATTAGLHNCSGDAAVIIDADLQDPPEVIPDMLALMKSENADVVYGMRKKRPGEKWMKRITSRLFYRLLNRLSDVKFPVDTGDFRLMNRKAIAQYNNFGECNKYVRGLISWMGFKQVPYHYERDARFAGETKYSFRKLLQFAFTSIFYFSKKPLSIATSLGFASIAVGLLYAIWILLSRLLTDNYSISGWTSTIIMIIFFGGVQLLTIGVLGKYIGNLFDEVKKRPEYIVSEKINF